MKLAVSPTHPRRTLYACQLCGTHFLDWDYEERRYCSRDCYHQARRLSKPRDLTGYSFGRWTVAEKDVDRSTPYRAYWWCVCACGERSSVDYYNLKMAYR